jgi:hypothetical protein
LKPNETLISQVSFSSRIPNAIPIGDASTMSSNVTVFNPKHILNLNDLIKDSLAEEEEQTGAEEEEETRSLKPGPTKFQPSKYDASPAISMISKHQNGSLNLWDVTFSPDSGFSQLLNIGHKARVNGHRWLVFHLDLLALFLFHYIFFLQVPCKRHHLPPRAPPPAHHEPPQHGGRPARPRRPGLLQRAHPLAGRLHLAALQVTNQIC